MQNAELIPNTGLVCGAVQSASLNCIFPSNNTVGGSILYCPVSPVVQLPMRTVTVFVPISSGENRGTGQIMTTVLILSLIHI